MTIANGRRVQKLTGELSQPERVRVAEGLKRHVDAARAMRRWRRVQILLDMIELLKGEHAEN